MSIEVKDIVSVILRGGVVKLSEWVEAVRREGWQAWAAQKGERLQEIIEAIVVAGMGRRPSEPKRARQSQELSPWPCKRCGVIKRAELSYSGWYERTVVLEEGSVRLRIPRLRCCRCRGSVSPDLGPVLRKRQRHWYDLHLTVMEQYTNGVSYRDLQRSLQHRGVYVGLSSLPRVMAEARNVSLHAQPVGNRPLAAQTDGAFWRVNGQLRAILHLLEVRPRIKDKGVGRHILRFETGQMVASVIATEESGQYWQLVMEEVYRRGWVTEKGELFLTSDGHEGIWSAAQMVFGFAVQQRCTWHIGRRARELAPTSCAGALENSAHWVFNASSHDELHERLGVFAQRWGRQAPQAVESVLRKVPQALSYLVATDFPLRPKTAAIAERHNLTYKRRLRSTRGFFRDDTFAGLIRLLELKHNCARSQGADWLHLAAADLWPQPIPLHHNTAPPPALPTPPSKPPPTTAYTIEGT